MAWHYPGTAGRIEKTEIGVFIGCGSTLGELVKIADTRCTIEGLLEQN